ncbi:recombinase family protein, partial [Vibrio sp. 10N.222.55.C6]
KEARLKCRTLINSVCKSIVIQLRGHDLKSEPLITMTFVTDEQFEFKVGKGGAVRFVDNDMAVNRRLQPLLTE